MPSRRDQTFSCPSCGEDVPTRAKACPHCGADDETGWSQDAEYAGLDLPNQDDDEDGLDAASAGGVPGWVKATVAIIIGGFIVLAILGW